MRKKKEKQPDVRSRKSPEVKKKISQYRLDRKLTVIGQNLLNNRMTTFDEVLAIISETSLSQELRISFYTFRKKIYDPNEFTRGEMVRMSELFKVPSQTVFDFISKIVDQNAKKRKLGVHRQTKLMQDV